MSLLPSTHWVANETQELLYPQITRIKQIIKDKATSNNFDFCYEWSLR